MAGSEFQVQVKSKPGSEFELSANLLNTKEGCANIVAELHEAPPTDFERKDLAVLNLLCAPSLSGSEKLDIPHCLARFNNLTEFVKANIQRNLYRFPTDSTYGRSEPMWRMGMLITLVKRNFGAAYHPEIRDDLIAGIGMIFNDSRDTLIHGLLTMIRTVAGEPVHQFRCLLPPLHAGCITR